MSSSPPQQTQSDRKPIKIKTRKRKRPIVIKTPTLRTPAHGGDVKSTQQTCGNKEKSFVPSILAEIPRATKHTQAKEWNTSSATHAAANAAAPDDDDDDPFDNLELSALPSDTILAFHSLLQHHSFATCSVGHLDLPFVLKPMLISALRTTTNGSGTTNTYHGKHDDDIGFGGKSTSGNQREDFDQIISANQSTGFHKEIHDLCVRGQIKRIQLQGLRGGGNNSGGNIGDDEADNEAIFEMKTYLEGVRIVMTMMKPSSSTSESTMSNSNAGANSDLQHKDANPISTFGTESHASDQEWGIIKLFLDSCTNSINNHHEDSSSTSYTRAFQGTFIHQKDLLQHLHNINNRRNQAQTYVLYRKTDQEWIDVLVHHQFLLPRTSAGKKSTYWFTLPGMGRAASLIGEGRNRMVQRLRRVKYSELKRRTLEMSGCNKKGMGMGGPFHVRDLVARGLVALRDTANGQFVRLVNE